MFSTNSMSSNRVAVGVYGKWANKKQKRRQQSQRLPTTARLLGVWKRDAPSIKARSDSREVIYTQTSHAASRVPWILIFRLASLWSQISSPLPGIHWLFSQSPCLSLSCLYAQTTRGRDATSRGTRMKRFIFDFDFNF